ncbi:MAG TPA: hypothetical protein VIS99_01280 [Terrimicrobiaceae bacterium]
MKTFAILVSLATTAASVVAGPAFVTMPPASTPAAPPTQVQGPLRASPDLNQAAMGQILNQLNQRQYQIGIAQNSFQRPIFVPQTINVKRAK